MTSLYDQYKKYRSHITVKETERVEKARSKREEGKKRSTACSFDGIRMRAEDPVRDEYIQIAYERMQKRHEDKAELPDIPDADRLFPGVGPRGNFCHTDMAFAQRLQKLRAAMHQCPPQNRALLQGLLDAPNEYTPDDPYFRLYDKMKKDCRNIRDTQMCAKVCPDRLTSSMLEQAAGKLKEQSSAIALYDKVLTGMEQLSGLVPGPMQPEAAEFLDRWSKRKKLPEVRTLPLGVRDLDQVPDHIQIQFQDMEDVMLQKWYSNPKRWHRSPSRMTEEVKSQDAMVEMVGRTVAANVLETMDLLFDHVDRQRREKHPTSHMDPPYLDKVSRDSLTIVDGKTLAEHLAERYEQGVEEGTIHGIFTTWYQQNAREQGAQIVAAALMQGKHVEAFIPDSQGRLPQEPTQLTGGGYRPSPLQPVFLNAWQRFANRHFGAYKEKADQARQYKLAMEARERARDMYRMSMLSEACEFTDARYDDTFYGAATRQALAEEIQAIRELPPTQDPQEAAHRQARINTLERPELSASMQLKKLLPPTHPLTLGRSSGMSFTVCVMAAQGWSIRDILDPNVMPQEKAALGRMIMDKVMEDPQTGAPGVTLDRRVGDADWIGQMYFLGTQELCKQMDALTNGVDLRDKEQYIRIAPQLSSISDVLFNVYQDCAGRNMDEELEKIRFRGPDRRPDAPRSARLAAGFWLAAEKTDPGRGVEVAKELHDMADRQGSAIKAVRGYHQSKAYAFGPRLSPQGAGNFFDVVIGDQYLRALEAQPNSPLSKKFPEPERLPSEVRLYGDRQFEGLQQAIDLIPDWRDRNKLVMDGIAEKACIYDPDRRTLSIQLPQEMDFVRSLVHAHNAAVTAAQSAPPQRGR